MSFQELNKASAFCWQYIIGSAELGAFVEMTPAYPGAPLVAHWLSKLFTADLSVPDGGFPEGYPVIFFCSVLLFFLCQGYGVLLQWWFLRMSKLHWLVKLAAISQETVNSPGSRDVAFWIGVKFKKENDWWWKWVGFFFFFTSQSTETQDSSGLRCVGHSTAPRRYKAEGKRAVVIKEMRKRREPK